MRYVELKVGVWVKVGWWIMTRDIPKGFKRGICECGNDYAYFGIDMGLCVKCIDKLEVEDDKK